MGDERQPSAPVLAVRAEGLRAAPASAPVRVPRAAAAPAPVPRARLVLLALAGAAVLTGLDAALLRLGLAAPVGGDTLASAHGVLMVYGFLGTAITLERAVALQAGAGGGRSWRAWWAHTAPAASGLGTMTLVAQTAGLPLPGGRAVPGGAWVAAMTALVAVYLVVWRRQPAYAVLVQLVGAVAGLAGAALWARGAEVAAIVPWWAALLVLTILGERLELARIAFLGARTEPRILGETLAVLVSLVLTLVSPAWGYPALGLTLAVSVLDVAVHDVARRTIRAAGLPRLMAACMLAGYGWALVAAGTWLVGGPAFSGYRYDTVVHALTIGFAMSMVVAHAPVIVPAIVRRPLPYHPALWSVVALLHGGLALRVVAGARGAERAWQLGGAVGVAALLAFLATTLALVVGAARGRRP